MWEDFDQVINWFFLDMAVDVFQVRNDCHSSTSVFDLKDVGEYLTKIFIIENQKEN